MVPLIDATGKCTRSTTACAATRRWSRLAKLKPFFDRKYGNVTPGNSSQITDGAAWLLLASEEAVKRHGSEPIGRIVDSAVGRARSGADGPRAGARGDADPAAARPRAERPRRLGDQRGLRRAGARLPAAWEDERYCRESSGSTARLGELDEGAERRRRRHRARPSGGRLGRAHRAASAAAACGAKDARRGIASICIGGGQGGAMLVETALR
jgi:acetyl-CoA C-acetyltransferase